MDGEQLPDQLGDGFSVHTAKMYGVGRGRLRSADLRTPFHGVRIRTEADAPVDDSTDLDPFQLQRRDRVARARDYAPRLHTGHFFSHHTAASIWGAPLPLELDDHGEPAVGTALRLHVCARGDTPLPRAAGVTRHRTRDSFTSICDHDGLRVSTGAATWVSLGELSVHQLVALGDFFCRRWRPGVGRRHAGRPPLATLDELREALDTGRRRGAHRLRTAIELIREDSWSPRESELRCLLIDAGLPEPELNIDVFDKSGRFLACVDLAYRDQRVAVEYHGVQHSARWAHDVERAAALRSAGWVVIEVTYPLLKDPRRLVARVAAALAR